ncbi:hypothetical protein FNH09_16235 [Streptomyces adustus]|uniref:Uncharacterized protein n=1 Tax=Streptomyces adustus TaxID=1609272 RepID=A0A5N8VC02_9ACTN|nr:hypothetical protein [Streptomyces adustus]
MNHIQNANQTIDGQLILNLFIGGAIAGVRQTIWGISPVGERFAYREMPPNSPTLLRNLLSESTMQAAFYTSHIIIKMPIVNGVSGQITPTEISQHDNQ